ncbi:MAG: hypothetical protein HND56_00640 [Pseudomonadota bacterium]|nr:MAG: hypothetical protein HND56_00640 [Pseudomonadota bacterium]|tara:strand:- start:1083 stop:1442 length:360 start_codon:yes stop_codon:yes gene_type:complete
MQPRFVPVWKKRDTIQLIPSRESQTLSQSGGFLMRYHAGQEDEKKQDQNNDLKPCCDFIPFFLLFYIIVPFIHAPSLKNIDKQPHSFALRYGFLSIKGAAGGSCYKPGYFQGHQTYSAG